MRGTQRHSPEVVFRPPKPPRWAGLELWRSVGGKPTRVCPWRRVRLRALATHRSSLGVFHWHHLGSAAPLQGAAGRGFPRALSGPP